MTCAVKIPPAETGITTRDAAMLIGEPESKIRTWKSRDKLVPAGDGRICPLNLVHWYDNERDPVRSRRGEVHQSKNNPYRRVA